MQKDRERDDSEREGGVLEYADRITKSFLVGLWNERAERKRFIVTRRDVIAKEGSVVKTARVANAEGRAQTLDSGVLCATLRANRESGSRALVPGRIYKRYCRIYLLLHASYSVESARSEIGIRLRKEVMEYLEAPDWIEALQKESDNLMESRTWEINDRPKD